LRMRSVRLPILYYHRVDDGLHPSKGISPRTFALQMSLLSLLGFRTVTFRDLVRFLEGHGRLPKKPAIVTFDDGYLDNYLNAAPILRRHGFSATVFLVSGRVGMDSIWVREPWDVAPLMNLEQVRELLGQGFQFGSHTRTHPRLVAVSRERAWDEIRGSKEDLENLLQVEVDTFCYPYGDYNDDVVKMVSEAGYLAARVVHTDNRHDLNDRYILRCVKVNGHVSLMKFVFYLTEWYHRETVHHRARRNKK